LAAGRLIGAGAYAAKQPLQLPDLRVIEIGEGIPFDVGDRGLDSAYCMRTGRGDLHDVATAVRRIPTALGEII
jgi:hypothetical protein